MPDTRQPSPAADLDEQRVVAELKRVLQETIFTSGRRIAPRRVDQIAQEIAASFLPFFERQDDEKVRSYGRHLALEGVGHHSVLALAEALRRVCWETPESGLWLLPISGRYVGALLHGYMQEREAYLLQVQEGTHQAALRVMSQSR